MPIEIINGSYYVTQIGGRPPIEFPVSYVNILRLPDNVTQRRRRPPTSTAIERKNELPSVSVAGVSVDPSPVGNGGYLKLKVSNKNNLLRPKKPSSKKAPKEPRPIKIAPIVSVPEVPQTSKPIIAKPINSKSNTPIIAKPINPKNNAPINGIQIPSVPSVSQNKPVKRKLPTNETRADIRNKLIKAFAQPFVKPVVNEPYVPLKLNQPFVIPRKAKVPSPEREPSPLPEEDFPDFLGNGLAATNDSHASSSNSPSPDRNTSSLVTGNRSRSRSPPQNHSRSRPRKQSPREVSDAHVVATDDFDGTPSSNSLSPAQNNSPTNGELTRNRSRSPLQKQSSRETSGAEVDATDAPTDDFDVLDLFVEDDDEFNF